MNIMKYSRNMLGFYPTAQNLQHLQPEVSGNSLLPSKTAKRENWTRSKALALRHCLLWLVGLRSRARAALLPSPSPAWGSQAQGCPAESRDRAVCGRDTAALVPRTAAAGDGLHGLGWVGAPSCRDAGKPDCSNGKAEQGAADAHPPLVFRVENILVHQGLSY